ncbi:RcnB family protein [Paracoccus aestuariivivens]|uniref:Nickel/cobalt transporter regulator n=1 Tax=Paracoccus aestuariivivens TaxID=1820333 RepID=A0A6L6JDC5_9RHOB|nr:RcnB family protein [Paracoccus aestuariivivens]MTH80122.1 hypothetical protein [Paracoccus aestuariivivens]
MKLLPLIVVVLLCACGSDEPMAHIYRYPEGIKVDTPYQPGMNYSSGGLVVDYHNHALDEPEKDQRWVLETGAFLLVSANGTIVSVVPAQYVRN